MRIQIHPNKIFIDILIFLGFSLDFMFFGKTLGQIGYLLVIAGGILCMLRKGRVRIRLCIFLVFYGLLVLYFQISLWMGVSISRSTSASYITTMVKCLVYMFFAYQYLLQKNFQEMVGFFTLFSLFLFFYLTLTGSIFSEDRLARSGLNANSVGMVCAFTVSLILYQLVSEKDGNPALLWSRVAIVGILLLVILLSSSRKSLILAMVPILIYYVYCKNEGVLLRILLACALGLLAYLAIMFVPPLYHTIGYRVEAMTSWLFTGNTEENSMLSRIDFIALGIYYFLQHPWTGIGLAAFSALEGAYGSYSHNNYIEMLVSGGIPALVLFYAPFVMLLVRLLRQRKTDKLCLFLGALLGCQLILHSAVVVYFTRRELFIYLFLFAAYNELSAQKKLTEKKES